MKTYTFHVHVPGTGRVWRKIEMVEDHTLEDLHWAIQDAFDFDGDHMFSFFMSGKAWDRSTEYSLPEDAFEWEPVDDEEVDEEDLDGGDFQFDDETAQAIQESLGDAPPPQSFEEMLNLVSSNAELRGQIAKLLSEEMGIPGFMANMLLKNAGSMMSMLPEGMMEAMFAGDDEDAPGDVRKTTLAELEIETGQHFMYLFDYGDEWRFDVKLDRIGAAEEAGAEYPRIVEAVGEAPQQYPDGEDVGEDDEAWEDEEEWDD